MTAKEQIALQRVEQECDIAALKACIDALDKSTSRRMLNANIHFIVDRYLWHPADDLPEHLRVNEKLADGV